MANPEVGSFYPRGVNNFVDLMQCHAEVDREGINRVKLNGVIAANAVGLLNGLSIASPVTSYAPDQTAYTVGSPALQTNNPGGGLAPYGRNIVAVASAAYAGTLLVVGRDYLGQPMTELLTMNGTTAVAGRKAFKWVDGFTTTTAGAGVTIQAGWGNVLGLPYCSDVLLQESVNDNATANPGTFTAAVKTSPASNITGDTRGTYTPNAANAPNGTNTYRLQVICDKDRLHGVRAA